MIEVHSKVISINSTCNDIIRIVLVVLPNKNLNKQLKSYHYTLEKLTKNIIISIG